MTDCISITEQNAEHRIREAIHTILHCWGEWDAEAMDLAQREQATEAYTAAMEDQVGAVLMGMIFDAPCDQMAVKPSLSVLSVCGESAIVVCDGVHTVRLYLKPLGVQQLIGELQHVLELSDV